MQELVREFGLVLFSGVFFVSFTCCAFLEARFARQRLTGGYAPRWLTNFTLFFSNRFFVKLAMPAVLAVLYVVLPVRESAVFNHVELPWWAMLLIALVVLDLVEYALHVAAHTFAPLWALHRVHHSDHDVDASTAVRHHPIEAIIAVALDTVVIWLLGIPVAIVTLVSCVGIAFAVFTHANIRLPTIVDTWLRIVFVTPDMHRIHHSTRRVETDSNYGAMFSWWDRMFRTYTTAPAGGFDALKLGLDEFRDEKSVSLPWVWLMPFKRVGPVKSASNLGENGVGS